MPHRRPAAAALVAFATAIALSACAGDAGGPAGPAGPAPVATVTVTPPTPSIIVGATVQLTAATFDASAGALTGRTITWSSNNASASVSTSGLVTGNSAGTATITATSEGKFATSTVTVTSIVVSYQFYKRGATATPGTATLTLPNGIGNAGTLSIDGLSIAVSTLTSGGAVTCFFGAGGSAVTSCASLSSPRTIRLCGPAGSPGNALVYVLFPTTDANRVASTSTALLAAVQSYTGYLGIGVFPGCAGVLTTSWIRDAPSTNYYLWPDVITTYSPSTVSALLNGAAIFSTPTAGNDFNQYVAVRVGVSLLEVWH